jgi:hypothetical protein
VQKEDIDMSKKSRKMKKTNLMKWDDLIRNTKKITPFCDKDGNVIWGTDKNAKKKKRLKVGGENCQEENNNI